MPYTECIKYVLLRQGHLLHSLTTPWLACRSSFLCCSRTCQRRLRLCEQPRCVCCAATMRPSPRRRCRRREPPVGCPRPVMCCICSSRSRARPAPLRPADGCVTLTPTVILTLTLTKLHQTLEPDTFKDEWHDPHL